MTQRPVEPDSASTTLIDRVKHRQADAWRRLVDVYGPLIYRWARRANLQPSDAADVVQEVFASVARNIDQFEKKPGQGGFRAWLAIITRNKIYDVFRRQQRQTTPRGGTDAWEQLAQVPDPEAVSDATDHPDDARFVSQRTLELVRAEFEPRTWEAFRRAVLDGEAPQDIAETMGLSINAVYKAKSRVLRRLRQELDSMA